MENGRGRPGPTSVGSWVRRRGPLPTVSNGWGPGRSSRLRYQLLDGACQGSFSCALDLANSLHPILPCSWVRGLPPPGRMHVSEDIRQVGRLELIPVGFQEFEHGGKCIFRGEHCSSVLLIAHCGFKLIVGSRIPGDEFTPVLRIAPRWTRTHTWLPSDWVSAYHSFSR